MGNTQGSDKTKYNLDRKADIMDTETHVRGLVVSISVDDRPNQLLYKMRLMPCVCTVKMLRNSSN